MGRAATLDRRQKVFLAYRAVFQGPNSKIRDKKVVTALVEKHWTRTSRLLQGVKKVVVIPDLMYLLEQEIFESDEKAVLLFLGLSKSSEVKTHKSLKSEVDAAIRQSRVLSNIVYIPDTEVDAAARGEERTLAAMPFHEEQIIETPEAIKTIEPTIKENSIFTTVSLYPLYFPLSTQHLIISSIQKVLEQCCFEFTQQNMPKLAETKQWTCAEAIELHKWAYDVASRFARLPKSIFSEDVRQLGQEILLTVTRIRHTAVHRIRTTAQGIVDLIGDAVAFTHLLKDIPRETELKILQEEINDIVKTLQPKTCHLDAKPETGLECIARLQRQLKMQGLR